MIYWWAAAMLSKLTKRYQSEVVLFAMLMSATCMQLREAAAAAMARHKAELPNQPMERSIDIPGQAQQAKRAPQRQYRQRGPDPDMEQAMPNLAAAEAAVTRMQEQEYAAKTRGKRLRGNYAACMFRPNRSIALQGMCMSVNAPSTRSAVCNTRWHMRLEASAASTCYFMVSQSSKEPSESFVRLPKNWSHIFVRTM